MISPAPDAPAGTVASFTSYSGASFPLTSAILCRNNAPLVAHAFALIRRGVPVRILGRDLGAGLTKVVKGMKAETTLDLGAKLIAWHSREIKKCKSAKQRDALDDKYSCLLTIAEACDSVAEVLSSLDRLFVSDASGPIAVTLATGHKAKGLEWDHVFILDRKLCPSRWASSERELTQERNLMYVMVTRARASVTYISSNCWKPN